MCFEFKSIKNACSSDFPRAKEYTIAWALSADPRNPVALKNLGVILGKEEGRLWALCYLRESQKLAHDVDSRITIEA